MTAKDLVPGNLFKYGSKQRQWRTVYRIIILGKAIPGIHEKGDVLIVLAGCGQVVLKPDQPVLIQS